MVRRALLLSLLVGLAGCLSTPPSGVIACQNNCAISGFYCAPDGYCWQNGELPTSTSSANSSGSGSSAGATGVTGTGGTDGSSAGSSGTSGKTASSNGSSTGNTTK